jgi:hypothetical protein
MRIILASAFACLLLASLRGGCPCCLLALGSLSLFVGWLDQDGACTTRMHKGSLKMTGVKCLLHFPSPSLHLAGETARKEARTRGRTTSEEPEDLLTGDESFHALPVVAGFCLIELSTPRPCHIRYGHGSVRSVGQSASQSLPIPKSSRLRWG